MILAITLTFAAIGGALGLGLWWCFWLSRKAIESAHLRGHAIYWDGETWRYADTDETTVDSERPCGHCGLADTPEGHDGCLGTLPGVRNACCGHGEERCAYIQFDDGRRVGGKEAVGLFGGLKVGAK